MNVNYLTKYNSPKAAVGSGASGKYSQSCTNLLRRIRGYFLGGGHDTMWDFADNQELAGIGAIYEAGGIVGAVCHGLAALVNLK